MCLAQRPRHSFSIEATDAALDEIERAEGSLDKFCHSYRRYGFVRVDGGIEYREWAPSARRVSVVGDFSTYRGRRRSRRSVGEERDRIAIVARLLLFVCAGRFAVALNSVSQTIGTSRPILARRQPTVTGRAFCPTSTVSRR